MSGPLRYEQVLDEDPSHPDLKEIKNIRTQTRGVIHQLWDASRDTDAIESHLLPVKQYNAELLRDELIASGPTRTKATDTVQSSELERMSIRNNQTPKKRLNTAAKHKNSSRQEFSRQSVCSPKKVQAPFVSQTEKQYNRSVQIQEKCWQVMNQSDEFYNDLQSFRKLHPDLCSKKSTSRALPLQKTIRKNDTDKPSHQSLPEDGYHYDGYFRVLENLQLEKINHPFQNTLDETLFSSKIDGAHHLNNLALPIKITIPNSSIKVTVPRVYRAHRRNSYGPDKIDSGFIGDYLFKGSIPYLADKRAKTQSASLKTESQIKRRN